MKRQTFSYKVSRFLRGLVDFISFDHHTRELVELLNRRVIDRREQLRHLPSHPGGFVRAFQKRRISIAESYMIIASSQESSKAEIRLEALRTLVRESLHAKTVSMPLNTARVQIALMKEAVKHIEDRQRQLELMRDFSLASYGQESLIRQFLNELNLLEVPEVGRPLAELDLGWDSHVHDNFSEGRKTPTQVILDAFIKGISRLTLVYYDISNINIISEALKAGDILGIDVQIGVEFSVGTKCRRRHYMYLPPRHETVEELQAFFSNSERGMQKFIDGLRLNTQKRHVIIGEMLEDFNREHLARINMGYPPNSIFAMKPLALESLEKFVMQGQYSRIHLGELVYSELKEVLLKRVLSLKAQYEAAEALAERGALTRWELETIGWQYRSVREQYENLTPESVRATYLAEKTTKDYDSEFHSEEDIFPTLVRAGGEIVFIHPLSLGLQEACSTVIRYCDYIRRIEVINMYDAAHRNPNDIMIISSFVSLLNNGTFDELKRFLQEWNITGISDEIIRKAFDVYHSKPLIPICSSDSTGRDPRIPGMGFIRASSIPLKTRRHFKENHFCLPLPVSALILNGGVVKNFKEVSVSDDCEIFAMGKRRGKFRPNRVGDEKTVEAIDLKKVWRYLNPTLKGIIRTAIGFLTASTIIGPFYATVWLSITFIRNIIVDLIAATGVVPTEWNHKDINFDNATQSLFWTGFSVPLMAAVKKIYDIASPFTPGSQIFEWTKFFFICLTNGTYIATHNTIRRFDRRVRRANFFRSVLSWPFAALFSPAGRFFGIPDIVQAKFWSDVVAGFVEGSGKFRAKLMLGKRDLVEILPNLNSENRAERLTAILDILYIWARQHRGRTSLEKLLLGRESIKDYLRYFFFKSKLTSDRNTTEDYLSILLQLVRTEGAMVSLENFVLENYSGKEAFILTELIGENFVEFTFWLNSLEKLTGKNHQKNSSLEQEQTRLKVSRV